MNPSKARLTSARAGRNLAVPPGAARAPQPALQDCSGVSAGCARGGVPWTYCTSLFSGGWLCL